MKSQYCGTGQTTEDYRSVPPHMRSVTKAIAKSPVGRERITKAKVQEKMFADARTPPSQEELDKRRSDRLRNRFADNQFEDDISSARSIATEKSSRGVLPVSPVTHRSSASRMSEVPHGLHKSHSMPVVERIDSLERMLLAEKTERESLKQELERERQQREESYAEMQKTQYKMKAYDNIMKGLLNVSSVGSF